ncbi:MAG: Fe-S assembly protein IscX [Alphaproteobacteria bacterium 16-39-46]|nr:MAG: Fe-S assembly protein IscX [Alphaproteobacteria bacterium 16-39-46]OZA43766.1 MAG: Fe-S assembly protein IscX [Alphaproteobacteria bacterium 17-39-52]HQS83583.1 Fe-S cluster assembly protein IscX [Alphaproteobacteria bacterium]HQS93318.1 Fe-S cluster assembly protein IscX [Alphaproteobacteria bacterium]
MKTVTWTDIYDIAFALEEIHPEVPILEVRFTDLWQWVQELPGFEDDPNRCNEKILESIQMAWLDERE